MNFIEKNVFLCPKDNCDIGQMHGSVMGTLQNIQENRRCKHRWKVLILWIHVLLM